MQLLNEIKVDSIATITGVTICTKCHALFKVPAMKECKTVAGVPSGLVKIMEKKSVKKEERVYTALQGDI